MSEKPQIKAWQTVLIWSSEHVNIGGCLAPSKEVATALAVHWAMTDSPPPIGATLKTVMAAEVSLEWLRSAVRTIETGGEAAPVLSLVPTVDAPSTPPSDEPAAG